MTKRAKPRGYLKPYKTYVFTNKDPVIDLLRTAVADSNDTNTVIAAASGVSVSTLSNWFHGATRRPQFATVNAVARAVGKQFVLTKYGR